ncbi:hypothetical protein [Thermogutta sp.]|uniref:hypothetical protein n=1 Tax=Thermogutta sp. TaxID=1962930 RepID=UPI0032203C50
MSMDESGLAVRDVQAAQLLLSRKIIELYPVPACGITPAQLRAAVDFAKKSHRIAALVCEDCDPAEKYLIIRLIDVPLLLSLLYELIANQC